ncbi:MAG: glycosyltransferase family 39 protein [Candidatus Obscuribacterales bacterium]|nr:glycosyltransferase family 39 protein [Candidatus Obscuribacterales bacterium]
MSTNAHSWEIKRHWLLAFLLMAALVAINFVCFGRTLGGYYLADDYIHVAYLSKVFSGHPELLWQNFYTNWLQTQGTQFYRPLISLTLALDYLFWGANPLGYHLTNTLYQCAASIFLFLLARRMLREFGERQATTAAFFTAAIFASFPLHAEVVSWIIGRVDGVCTAFYLATFWLFVCWYQDRNKKHLYLSLATFFLSLLSKEMAITLPPTLVVYVLLAAHKIETKNWLGRLKEAASATWIFWAMLVGYLVVRTLSLGTVAGGYMGSIGEGLDQSLYKRLFVDGSLNRVLLPFDASVFSPFNKLRKTLLTLYLVGGITLLLRAELSRKMESEFIRFVGFAVLWFVISMIPTYQVFNLTDNLQSSRFIYMGTAPLSLLLVLLMYPLVRWDLLSETNELIRGRFFASLRMTKGKLVRFFQVVACVLLIGFVVCFVQIAQGNNKPWVAAGREVRALRHELERTVGQLEPGKKLVLLNLPQRVGGAHELYNAAMLWILLQPPLTTPGISDRVVTFEPMTYGDSEIFIVSRLRRMLEKDPNGYEFYSWNRELNRLNPVHLSLSGKGISFGTDEFAHLSFRSFDKNMFVVSPQIDIAPAVIDFIDVYLTIKPGVDSAPVLLSLYWNSEGASNFSPERRLTLRAHADGKHRLYRFNVSEHKSWIMAGNISRLRLDLPPGSTIDALWLRKGDFEIPKLVPDDATVRLDIEGTYRIPQGRALFKYDVSKMYLAKDVVVEVSKPDSWFEHYSGQLRDKTLSDKSLKSWHLGKTQGTFELDPDTLPVAGYYQVRIAAIDDKGRVVGYVSDPVNLQVNPVRTSNVGEAEQERRGAGRSEAKMEMPDGKRRRSETQTERYK